MTFRSSDRMMGIGNNKNIKFVIIYRPLIIISGLYIQSKRSANENNN